MLKLNIIPALFLFFALLIPIVTSAEHHVVGQCDSKNTPKSWLYTGGHGLDGYATAGVPVNKGSSFCLEQNSTEEIIQVMYQINITDVRNSLIQEHKLDTGNLTNGCLNKDPRIHYCAPFCFNDDLQLAMIDAALKSNGSPDIAVLGTMANFKTTENWAFTVIQVNLTANPQAHLVIQSFEDPAWCSVYVGMKTFGDPYLYEMQAGIVLT